MDEPESDHEEAEPTEIELDGEGPFILPVCDSDVDLALGEMFALLEVTTLDGKAVQIPFGHAVLQVLHELTGQALQHLASHNGETLQ
jgi:hypothetical protein